MSTREGTEARWQVSSVLRELIPMTRGPQHALRDLERARHARDGLLRAIDLLSDAAIREGASYADIGRALGTSRQDSRQAAQLREAVRLERDEAKAWRLPPRLPQRRPRRAVEQSARSA